MEKVYTDRDIEMLAEPLFESMASRVTPEEMETMHRAFQLARTAHASQRRKSGEPYIIHPIAVARIVGEELQLGANPVCAAFLHDVVEDTDYTIEDIESMFGSDIAFLVKVVTKTKKEKYESSKQIDNFRQMLDSINYDIRPLLIKLADRLHNMRTLASMRPDKQMKIAGETDYFYAPLANRLGMYFIKTELENLSFKYRCPMEYEKLEALLDEEKKHIRPYLERFRERVLQQLSSRGIPVEVDFMTRRPYSIRRRMRESNTDFYHLEGMHVVNVIYDVPEGKSEKDLALEIYSSLTDVFEEKPHSVANFIDHPKENGYPSLHVHLMADNGHWQEVHISSRRMLRVQNLGCVADGNEQNIAKWIGKLKMSLKDIAMRPQGVNFMDSIVSSFYLEDIIVYTPDGRPITLPQRASALDFAFELGKEIGIHAKYAVINGRIHSVKTLLNRGDIIEIGTSDDVTPADDWLAHVYTYRSKRSIKDWLAFQPKPDIIRCEHCNPIPGDEVIGFRLDDGRIAVHKRDCKLAISIASQSGDSVVPVDFKADDTKYPVRLHFRAVDRSHLLSDLIDCITKELNLSIKSLKTDTVDNIVDCDIEFYVNSAQQKQTVINALNDMPSVDEVWHLGC